MCGFSSPKVAKVQKPTVQAEDTAAAQADSDARARAAALQGRAALASQQTGYLGVPNNQNGGYNL